MLTYYLIIISMPYIQHPIWDKDFGGGFTMTKLLGGICLLYAAIHLARRHRIPRFFATPQSKWMVAFFATATYSYVVKGSASWGLNPIFTYGSAFLFFFITVAVIDSVKRLYWSLMVALGSVAFASLYVIREWQKSGGGDYRPGYLVGDANYFTVAALALLPIGFELMLIADRKWHKYYCIGCLFLIFAAITLGASRGGFLGIIADVIYLTVRSRRPLRNAARIALFVLPFLIVAPNSPLHRLISPNTGDTGSVQLHLEGWEAGLTMIKLNPLTGVGIGNYKPTIEQYDRLGLANTDPHIAHNGFLEVAAEMGLPGFGLYLIFFGTTFWSVGSTRKRAQRRGAETLAAIALGMQASMLGVWVAIFFVSGQYTKLFWLILCMTMALPQLLPPRSIATRREMPPPDQLREEAVFQVGEALVALS